MCRLPSDQTADWGPGGLDAGASHDHISYPADYHAGYLLGDFYAKAVLGTGRPCAQHCSKITIKKAWREIAAEIAVENYQMQLFL